VTGTLSSRGGRVARYCTFFDQRYLDRGLAMIRSLRAVEPGAAVTVLCLTSTCAAALRALDEPGVSLVTLPDFERANPDLLAVKSGRSPRDYVFTLASCLVASVLAATPAGEVATYLDADLFFYSSPAPLFAAMEGASVGLVGHRHHWWTRRLEKYGRLNVGWVSFRADAAGRAAASWWRARCLEWCFAWLDGDRFADQKYLDHMIAALPGVREIDHPGANVGPWNVCRHRVGRRADGSFVVDGRHPLVFFHYSGVVENPGGEWSCSNISYLGPFPRLVREELYRPYIARILEIRAAIGGLPEEETVRIGGSPPARRARIMPLLRLAGRLMGHHLRVP
jgi:hypothetical protein